MSDEHASTRDPRKSSQGKIPESAAWVPEKLEPGEEPKALSVDEEIIRSLRNSNVSMWGRQREVARLAALGFKCTEIAEKLDISYACAYQDLHNPIVQSRIAAISEGRDRDAIDIKQRVQELTPLALDVMTRILTEDPENTSHKRLQKDIAVEILDRGEGANKIQRIQTQSTVLNVKDIEEVQARAEQIRHARRSNRVKALMEDNNNGA